jgi:hypothetical protein
VRPSRTSIARIAEICSSLGRGEPAREGLAEVDAALRASSVQQIVSLAAEARARFGSVVGRTHPHDAPLATEWVDELARPYGLALACVLTIHRNGYYRETGTRYLAASDDGRGLPFLLLRADDIVETIRALAVGAVERRLTPGYASHLARALRIVEVLRQRQRGNGGPLVRAVHALLLDQTSLLRQLVQDESDAVARMVMFRLLLQRGDAAHTLTSALSDGDTRIRAWAARQAISKATNDSEKRELVPRLLAAGSARARVLGLRAHAKLGLGDAELEAALLDSHAMVRYWARVLLRDRHPARDFDAARRAALSCLADERATVAQRVGALGALGDCGLATDLAQVDRWITDRSPRLRVEATRTRRLLAGG